MLDYIVIGMVLDEELTGYDIKKEVNESIGIFYRANYGRLYPTLKKLAEKEYLTMNEQMQGNRLKKYYKATALGKEYFMEWLSAPVDLMEHGETQLSKIFFYGELPKEIRTKRLQEYEFLVEQLLHQLLAIKKEVDEEMTIDDVNNKHYYQISTLFYGLQNGYSTLNWLKYIKEQKPFSKFITTSMEEK